MKNIKKIISLFLIMIMSLVLISCSKSDGGSKTLDSSKVLKVHFIDVGQADSILIQQGNESMLIDAGNNDDEDTLKNYFDSLGISEFKYLVGTHPHEDHIGSLDYIINSFKIGTIYFPKVTSTTRTFENVVNAANNKNMQFTVPKVGETFNLGEAKCTILAPNNSSYENLNDFSIVIKVEYGDTSFLFTGDAENISEDEMLKNGLNLKADVLKAGHHGSNSSSSTAFLDAVNPKYAVISVGKNNDYGHPHKETLDKFNQRGIKVYRTDESGTIIATSDGKNITFDSKSSGNSSASKDSSSTSKADKSNSLNSQVEKEAKDTDSSNSKKNNNAASGSTGSTKTESSKSASNKDSETVWVSSNSAKVYHKDKTCSGMKNPQEYTLKEAEAKGLKPCSKCAD